MVTAVGSEIEHECSKRQDLPDNRDDETAFHRVCVQSRIKKQKNNVCFIYKTSTRCRQVSFKDNKGIFRLQRTNVHDARMPNTHESSTLVRARLGEDDDGNDEFTSEASKS